MFSSEEEDIEDVEISDLLDEPEAYYGETVAISDLYIQRVGDDYEEILVGTDEEPSPSGDGMYCRSKNTIPSVYEEGDQVSVTGTFREGPNPGGWFKDVPFAVFLDNMENHTAGIQYGNSNKDSS
jgi:hypothetical protein